MFWQKNRDYVVLTNDKSAHWYCKKVGVEYLNVQEILRFMLIENIIDVDDVKEIIKLIEDKDNTIIKNKERIWKDYE